MWEAQKPFQVVINKCNPFTPLFNGTMIQDRLRHWGRGVGNKLYILSPHRILTFKKKKRGMNQSVMLEFMTKMVTVSSGKIEMADDLSA